jgi:hypothetical protein
MRQIFLEIVAQFARAPNMALSSRTLLVEVRDRVSREGPYDMTALMTLWSDMFRQGVLGWGFNVDNSDPPWLHITERGRITLANLSRDPSNPDGYIAHVVSVAKLNPIAASYIREALETYNAVCYKATAVMVGCAAESMMLELRDAVVARLTALSRPVPADLNKWMALTVMRALQAELDRHKGAMPKELREEYESNWPAMLHEIRVVRNDAGHPTDVAPVTPETAHATLLIFPQLAALATRLRDWVTTSMP